MNTPQLAGTVLCLVIALIAIFSAVGEHTKRRSVEGYVCELIANDPRTTNEILELKENCKKLHPR